MYTHETYFSYFRHTFRDVQELREYCNSFELGMQRAYASELNYVHYDTVRGSSDPNDEVLWRVVSMTYWHVGSSLANVPRPCTYSLPTAVSRMPSPTNPEPTCWKERAFTRFLPEWESASTFDGYTDLPARVYKRMFELGCHPEWDHFLHLPLEGDNIGAFVAYFPDAKMGKAGRVLRQRFGRYLKKFYPHLTVPQIAELSATLRAEGESLGLQFARTVDDIEWVYRNGPRSCMAYEREHYDCGTDYHPTHVYATEDIGIAYITDPVSERVTARAVCNMNDKAYYAVYGDEIVLEHRLTEAGFRETRDALVGCRLNKIELDYGLYLMVYLDGERGLVDAGDYWIIGGDDECADSDSGVMPQREKHECDACGQCLYEEYMVGWYCVDCVNDVVYVYGLGDTYQPWEQGYYQNAEGEYLTDSYAERQGLELREYNAHGDMRWLEPEEEDDEEEEDSV